MRKQKEANPSTIPYALCWYEGHPGYVSLRFIGGSTVRFHSISISPKGYSWANSTFPSVDNLINAFKRRPQGPRISKPQKPTTSSTKETKPATARGRWGDKETRANRPPPPPVPKPSYTNAPPQQWNHPPPPPAIPGGVVANAWGSTQPPQQPRIPNRPPPPPRPPTYGQPPPPQPILPPPPPVNPPQPPSYKNPAFDKPAEPQGRGRGRTLPAWMSKG